MHGDANATHLEALAWAVARTTGPILELGVGWYSTPMLIGFGAATGRLVVSVESHPGWAKWAKQWERSSYRIVEPIDGIHPATNEKWGLVFVDHGYGDRRAESVSRYRGTVIVVHDTQPEVEMHYPGLATALQVFPNRVDFRNMKPWTTVVSG